MEKLTRHHRTTLGRLKKGDTGVSLGVLLTVLESLRELDDIELLLSQPDIPGDERKTAAPYLDPDF